MEHEILERVAGQLGVELQYVPADFDRQLVMMEQSQADMLAGQLVPLESRSGSMEFTVPYAHEKWAVVAPVDRGLDPEDLSGLTIGVPDDIAAGHPAYAYAEEHGAARVAAIAYGSLGPAIQKGSIDCAIVYKSADTIFDEYGCRIAGTLDGAAYVFGVSKGNTELRDLFSAELQKLLDDGTVQEILDRCGVG